ncbi:MAG: hypothetical protein U9P37_01535, partial [Pseudomonadota bacterium]|nr:hypothetical protein [Pseudomonadota bacterium]
MLFTKKSIMLAIIFTGLFFSSAFAADLDVCPTGCAYSSIQAAVNEASDGDTIRVAQGLYFENIRIQNPITVTIQGGWDSTFSTRSSDPALTVVNGMGLYSVFYIRAYNDENITVTIEGLTITNGCDRDGGGIYAAAYAGSSCTTDSSLNLLLSNNRIVGNWASNGGGGIYVDASTYSN